MQRVHWPLEFNQQYAWHTRRNFYAKRCLQCGHRKKQFTVKVGTVFEHARMPLHKMLQAVFLMTSSKKGVSAHQLHRTLEVTYKTAWFLAHRIREAMRSGDLAPFGVGGGIIEVDETFIGNDRTILQHARTAVDAAKVALGERGPAWWSDGATDLNRSMVAATPYTDWQRDLTKFAELDSAAAPKF